MKQIKLFLIAIISISLIAFTGCDNGNEPGSGNQTEQQGGNGNEGEQGGNGNEGEQGGNGNEGEQGGNGNEGEQGGNGNEGEQGGNGNEGEQQGEIESIVTKTFTLEFDNKIQKNGEIYEVTMDSYDELLMEMVAHINLKNTSSSNSKFMIKELRKYDLTKFFPSLCIDNCMPGNGKDEQIWPEFTIKGNSLKELQLHLMVIEETTTTCPAEFTISNGTESVKFTMSYNYVAPAK